MYVLQTTYIWFCAFAQHQSTKSFFAFSLFRLLLRCYCSASCVDLVSFYIPIVAVLVVENGIGKHRTCYTIRCTHTLCLLQFNALAECFSLSIFMAMLTLCLVYSIIFTCRRRSARAKGTRARECFHVAIVIVYNCNIVNIWYGLVNVCARSLLNAFALEFTFTRHRSV